MRKKLLNTNSNKKSFIRNYGIKVITNQNLGNLDDDEITVGAVEVIDEWFYCLS